MIMSLFLLFCFQITTTSSLIQVNLLLTKNGKTSANGLHHAVRKTHRTIPTLTRLRSDLFVSKRTPPDSHRSTSSPNLKSFHTNGSHNIHKDANGSGSNQPPLSQNQNAMKHKGAQDFTKIHLNDDGASFDFDNKTESNSRTIQQTCTEKTKQSYWRQFYQMMRPGNFPGVVLFHVS